MIQERIERVRTHPLARSASEKARSGAKIAANSRVGRAVSHSVMGYYGPREWQRDYAASRGISPQKPTYISALMGFEGLLRRIGASGAAEGIQTLLSTGDLTQMQFSFSPDDASFWGTLLVAEGVLEMLLRPSIAYIAKTPVPGPLGMVLDHSGLYRHPKVEHWLEKKIGYIPSRKEQNINTEE